MLFVFSSSTLRAEEPRRGGVGRARGRPEGNANEGQGGDADGSQRNDASSLLRYLLLPRSLTPARLVSHSAALVASKVPQKCPLRAGAWYVLGEMIFADGSIPPAILDATSVSSLVSIHLDFELARKRERRHRNVRLRGLLEPRLAVLAQVCLLTLLRPGQLARLPRRRRPSRGRRGRTAICSRALLRCRRRSLQLDEKFDCARARGESGVRREELSASLQSREQSHTEICRAAAHSATR